METNEQKIERLEKELEQMKQQKRIEELEAEIARIKSGGVYVAPYKFYQPIDPPYYFGGRYNVTC